MKTDIWDRMEEVGYIRGIREKEVYRRARRKRKERAKRGVFLRAARLRVRMVLKRVKPEMPIKKKIIYILRKKAE